MGFFDKVKAMKNAMTGGAAKVYLDSDPVTFDEPFKVRIRVQVDDAPLKINRVYLYVKGEERVEVPDFDFEYDIDGNSHRTSETVRASEETVDLDISVAEGQELEANESYEWEVEVELPSHAPAFYRGRFCEHVYTAYAGLDAFGNDPDSGWVDLHQ